MTKKHRSIYLSEELLEKISEEQIEEYKRTGKIPSFNSVVVGKLEEAFNFKAKVRNDMRRG